MIEVRRSNCFAAAKILVKDENPSYLEHYVVEV